MKKWLISLFTALFMMLGAGTGLSQEVEAKADEPVQKVELTKEQQDELAKMYEEMLQLKKDIVSTYVEYGVLSTEKAEIKIQKFEERYQKLAENGFIPTCKKCKK